jgi:hypothetical protein
MNRILGFDEFRQIRESYSETDETSLETDLELSKEKIQNLVQQLSLAGITKNTPGVFKFVDNDGINYKLMMTPTGKIEIIEELTEGIKDNLLTGVVCTMLASGMISCKKDTSGFGYNFSSQATEYTLGKGDSNKKVLFSGPNGDEELKVDSNLAKQSTFWGSQGSKFTRAITPTEALILKAGHAYSMEKKQNNGQGTRPEQKWDYDPKYSKITGPYYKDESASFETCREHPLWEKGLEALRKEGQNVDQLVAKANQEVAKGITFEYD